MTYKNRIPFLLRPAYKDYLWGGTRLDDEFGKGIESDIIAETWECSTHPDGLSFIASGPNAGKSLSEYIKQSPDILGSHPRKKSEEDLLILIKLIDAKDNLSIQVHPDDEYAFTYENGQLGKTEVWYVLDAEKGSSLVYGLQQDISREELRQSVDNGTLEKYLQKVPVKKGDVFFVRPGTIHAIGRGVLIAEIQESSNLTYRLYDYNRTDKYGNKRALHLDKALEVINYSRSSEPRQRMKVTKHKPGWAQEMVFRCEYFQFERILLNTEVTRQMVSFHTDEVSFQVFLFTDGCCTMFFEDQVLPVFKGDCVFIPADSPEIKLHGKTEFLKISC